MPGYQLEMALKKAGDKKFYIYPDIVVHATDDQIEYSENGKINGKIKLAGIVYETRQIVKVGGGLHEGKRRWYKDRWWNSWHDEFH
jgi:hypothetical protein